MKFHHIFSRYMLLAFLVLTLSKTAQCQNYGAGVTHSAVSPSAPPQYPVKPSLTWYDSTMQALWVNNKTDWWLLMAPLDRYVRGYLVLPFAKDQILQFSDIEFQFRSQAGAGRKLNGLYIAKFISNSGDLRDLANITVNGTPYVISQGDYLICRYYKHVFQAAIYVNDKTNVHYSIINNTLEFHQREIDSLRRRGDTLILKTDTLQRQIDTLKQKLDTIKTPPSVSNNSWLITGNSNIDNDKFLGTPNNNDIRFKTNNIERVIFNKIGKNGFGVQDPTQEVDALNVRNRGSYYDGFNNSGKQGQVIVSIIDGTKTAWSDNYKFTQLEHTAPDNAVLTGLSKSVAVVPYAHFKLRSITFTTQGAPQNGNLILKVFYRKPNTAVPYDVLIVTRTIPQNLSALHENFTSYVNGYDVEHGGSFRIEVTNSANNSATGLTAVFGFSMQ